MYDLNLSKIRVGFGNILTLAYLYSFVFRHVCQSQKHDLRRLRRKGNKEVGGGGGGWRIMKI